MFNTRSSSLNLSDSTDLGDKALVDGGGVGNGDTAFLEKEKRGKAGYALQLARSAPAATSTTLRTSITTGLAGTTRSPAAG